MLLYTHSKMLLPLFLTSVLMVPLCRGQTNWALLVAGSNHYDNYRHQADVCHAYHVLRDHGFPEENIITMMYDDIAHNKMNPFPGNIINHPNGSNVYNGVKIDYSKEEVSQDVFLKVLTGDSSGILKSLGRRGKIIESGPSDRIFVNFVDHGMPGFLLFPKDMLKAADLHKAVQTMHTNKKYKEMVFYVEACESGSMFANHLYGLLDVYATTAANPKEPSIACYWDNARQVYLGDTYSVSWMEDSDKENLKKETLDAQYRLVKNETHKSHVMRYGDLKIGAMKLADFQGNLTKSASNEPSKTIAARVDTMPSDQVSMETLRRRIQTAEGDMRIILQADLDALIKRHHLTEEFFKDLTHQSAGPGRYQSYLTPSLHIKEPACYYEGVRLITEMCPGMNLIQNEYAHRKLRVLVNLCDSGIPHNTIFSAIRKISYNSTFCSY